MSNDQNERRRQELEALALAASKLKLNKVVESLAYDAGTIFKAACRMSRIANEMEQADDFKTALRGTYMEPTMVDLNCLMKHSETPESRAAIATAYHNMKTSENRLN